MEFYTIGHSNREPDQFLKILAGVDVRLVVDVRAFPRSRANPAYSIDVLPLSLATADIGYEHWPELGGRRPRQHGVPDDCNAFWRNRSFHNYADYALSGTFHNAINTLIGRSLSYRLALMCSEAAWWRCHRRIITDYLISRGCTVFHLMSLGRLDLASPSHGSKLDPSGNILYPSQTTPYTCINNMHERENHQWLKLPSTKCC